MILRPPRYTRTHTPLPYSTLFRSADLVEHRLDRISVGHVCLDQKGVAAGVLDRLQRFLGGFAAAVIVDRDADAGAGECDRDRSADVASAAGDERGFPLESHVMDSLFLIVGGLGETGATRPPTSQKHGNEMGTIAAEIGRAHV